MKIYTKSGDKGSTSLFGGERISKADLLLEIYGTIDELNSFIGIAASKTLQEGTVSLEKIQKTLFGLGALFATMPKDWKKFNIQENFSTETGYLEAEIDRMTEQLPELKNFILPKGDSGSAVHVCRSVCRRVERKVVRYINLHDGYNVESALIYLNRLSDYFFTLARYENFKTGTTEIIW
jgi:cob(I)alamin adenosyltransferase